MSQGKDMNGSTRRDESMSGEDEAEDDPLRLGEEDDDDSVIVPFWFWTSLVFDRH